MILLNSFSANMLAAFPASVSITEVSVERARTLLLADGIQSAIGHADTAAVLANLLGMPVEMRRATIALRAGGQALVGQYSGPRLPEGSTTLPEGAVIKWLFVHVS